MDVQGTGMRVTRASVHLGTDRKGTSVTVRHNPTVDPPISPVDCVWCIQADKTIPFYPELFVKPIN